MELRCIMCGRKEVVSEETKDGERLLEKPKTVYICTRCQAKTYNEAKEGHKPIKPL